MHDAIHIYLLCSCDACWRSQHICLYHFVFRHVPEMWPSTLKAFSLANIWRCFPHVYTQSSGPCRHFGRDKISFFACGWPPMSSGTNEFDVTNEFGENTHGRCLFFFYIYMFKERSCPLSLPSTPQSPIQFQLASWACHV